MARRELLRAEERAALFGTPTDRASLANRLGAALWLVLFRNPGFGFRFDDPPPGEVVDYLADQLGV